MDPHRFSTEPLPPRDQMDAWSAWFQPVFDVYTGDDARPGFNADYLVWNFGDISLTRVSAPATRTVRTSAHVRRSPIDHWVISYCHSGSTAVSTRDLQLDARPGVPFVWSLGHSSDSYRTGKDRLQLYLPRDSFSDIGHSLDLALGSMLATGPGQLLADYMVLLDRNLLSLTIEEAARLPAAIHAMVAACVAPSADRVAHASAQIESAMFERIRRAVSKNLRTPSLGPDKLCRETAMSRSQLYRIFRNEGGVAKYIQRRRLSESFSMLCDDSNILTIAEIADNLCFTDSSSFSRAFRREFGASPMEIRAASRYGLRPSMAQRTSTSHQMRKFLECLRTH